MQAEAPRDLWAALLEDTPVAMAVWGPDVRFLGVNRAFGLLTGLTVDEHTGLTCEQTLGTAAPSVRRILDQVLAYGHAREGVELTAPGDPDTAAHLVGSFAPVRDTDGSIVAVGAVLQDVTEQHVQRQLLSYQASHDQLSGLPNRDLFMDRLQVALHKLGRSDATVAVLFFDLDHFKTVNDSLGHKWGDRLLRTVAIRLERELRPGDTVARLGGDEFAMLCEGISSPQDAVRIGERMVAAAAESVAEGNDTVEVTASVGIAIAYGSEVDPSALVRDADVAMYQAKELGRNRVALFDSEMRKKAVARIDVQRELRTAIDEDQLLLHYQPVIDVPARALLGVEALVRWQHPRRGLLEAGQFIPLAEQSGLIVELGAWVLDEACRQLAEWVRAGVRPPGRLSINVSGRQLAHDGFADLVSETLARHGLSGDSLSFEVAESVIMTSGMPAEVLDRIKELGVRLSVDDFGTGSTSLPYLNRLGVDALKVDRSFVERLRYDDAARVVTSVIVQLSKALQVDVIAEGVEHRDQMNTLLELGCRTMQGYVFSVPLSSGDMGVLLREPDRLTASIASIPKQRPSVVTDQAAVQEL